MKNDSSKLEVILKEKYMCYNKYSSHPRVIRLGDGLEGNHISALRTAIYQIGSQDEEMKQVKATIAQVLMNKEEKLISNFVKNHFRFRLTQVFGCDNVRYTSSNYYVQKIDYNALLHDRRSGTLFIGNDRIHASLLDRPAIVESYKTYDESEGKIL
ncbi:hypothetical protein AgCh_022100 [Apium graveolens]